MNEARMQFEAVPIKDAYWKYLTDTSSVIEELKNAEKNKLTDKEFGILRQNDVVDLVKGWFK